MAGFSFTKEANEWRVTSGDKPLVVLHGGNITVMPKNWQYSTGFSKKTESSPLPESLQDTNKYDHLDLNQELNAHNAE